MSTQNAQSPAFFPGPMCLKKSRIIGLTGGIATGKSTVSGYLANTYSCRIYDADLIAREAVRKGSFILNKLTDRYGVEILTSQGELNRSKLGKILFQDSDEKKWIESLIHPYVLNELQEKIQTFRQSERNTTEFLCLAIPLLFESKMENLASEIWVVACSPETQLERLRDRNNFSDAEAKTRINSQWPLEKKKQRADVILNNDGDRNKLYAQIDAAIKTPPDQVTAT